MTDDHEHDASPPIFMIEKDDRNLVSPPPSTPEAAKQKATDMMQMRTKKDKIRMGVAVGGFVLSMAIIITGTVLGAVAAANKPHPVPSFRLPKTLKPLAYVVKLQPFVDGNFSVSGFVEVEMKVVKETKNITLHLADIITHNDTIKVWVTEPEGEHDGKVEEEVVVSKHEYDPERQWYVARLDRKLHVNQTVVLSMNFTGLLNDQLRGFYRSSYTGPDGNTVRLAASFFAPTNARRAFPCMDEPALKARFTVSLARETHMKSLSNMPLLETKPVSGQAGWLWDHFNTTVPMSTYLVAFVISDFTNKTSGDFLVWSRSEVLDQADYALEIGPRVLDFYEDYFNISYPLPKIDLVALPELASKGMENWGLITFSEDAMLLNESAASASVRQTVTEVVSHELAHQWFGNLVTAYWWADIWLNEGFATYIANVAMNDLEPDWDILQQEVLTVQAVMGQDGLESSHPITQPVSQPDDIAQIYDDIAYSKGSSVLRMMSYFLTEDTFRRGLTNYLNHFAYDVATQDDLWEYLTEAAKEDNKLPGDASVKDIMDTWTLQMGYPVVTVTRSADGSTATLAQELFLLLGNSRKQQEYSWWIPLSYTTADAPDFNQTQPRQWMKAGEVTEEVVGLPAKEHWVIYNVQETGYFRVNYDDDNWFRISEQLQENHEMIHVVNRAQLMDDALNLARSGRLSYKVALELNTYLLEENEYVPWSAALTSLSYLEEMMTRTSGYENLKRYLLTLLLPLYEDVVLEGDSEDLHIEQVKRSLVVAWACKLGHRGCVDEAVLQFKSWMNDTLDVSPNVKSTVYCTGVAEGGQEVWEDVWARYLEAEVASERTVLLEALGCVKEPETLADYLDKAFTEDSGIRKQDSILVFSSVAKNDVGRTIAWDFLKNEWTRIVNYYDTFSSLGSLIASATSEFNTRSEKQELEAFKEEHESTLGTATRAVQLALESTDINIAWLENYLEVIEKWLEEYLAIEGKLTP